ncbi:MAG: hypothetical protein IPM27_10835 [Nitrosomonadales bacterium]|nr:hypothetical protein [Nitrosomonadales bacterium]
MTELLQRDAGSSPQSACENCIHTFRKKESKDEVVCIPHLKTMLARHPHVCDLYVNKTRKRSSR